MKRLILLALIFLAACTGTKGEHDPVALIVATELNGQHALQLVETKNLQALVGDPLVVHDGFTKLYPVGTSIVQLGVPDQRRTELWVLYTDGSGVFIDVFTPSSIVLSQPTGLSPSAHIQLSTTEVPYGFAVHGDEIAVREDDGVVVYNREGDALKRTIVIDDPFEIAPVYVRSEVYSWSESLNNTLELVHLNGPEKFSFGPIAHRPPAVTADLFDRNILVHIGANGHISLLDQGLMAESVTVTVAELGTAQEAFLVGSRLLVRTATALEQVSLALGDNLEAHLVGRDSLSSQDLVVLDPYNQYAYPLRMGFGEIISTLGGIEPGEANGSPPRQRVHASVALPSLGAPFAGEAFIVSGGP